MLQNITITITKVSGPYVVIFLDLTSRYEWYVARLVVTNGHQKGMPCKGIRLCAQSVDFISRFHTQPSTIGRVHVII